MAPNAPKYDPAIRTASTVHIGRYTMVERLGTKGISEHEYQVLTNPPNGIVAATVKFQQGDEAINGCFMEDLLLIVEDRLKEIQAGPFPLDENARALDCVRGALAAMAQITGGPLCKESAPS